MSGIIEEQRESAPRVLFSLSVYQFTRETLPVIRYFAGQGCEVHVLVGFHGPASDEYQALCRAAGWTVHELPSEVRYGDPHSGPNTQGVAPGTASEVRRNTLFWKVRSTLEHNLAAFRRFTRQVAHFRSILRTARDIIPRINPDVMLSGPFHSCGKFDEAAVVVTRQLGIPHLCMSVSPYAGERNWIGARFTHLRTNMISASLHANFNWFNRLISRLFPRWVRSRDGATLFCHDPQCMLAAHVVGLLPANPWEHPSCDFDYVFVESDFSRQVLIDSPYPAHKIIAVGKPLLDTVFQELRDESARAALYDRLGLAADQPFVLVNVEPSAEHNYESWDVHWMRFRRLMDALRSSPYRVVLSLHPLCQPKNYMFVEAEFGYRISLDFKIMQLYPFASLVVSYPCSTNTMSAIFQNDLIIYDYYEITGDDSIRKDVYRMPGALYARSVEELAPVIQDRIAAGLSLPGGVRENPLSRASENIYRFVKNTVLPEFKARRRKR